MSTALAPAISPNRVAALLGITRQKAQNLLNAMCELGLEVEDWPFERGMAAIRAHLAGHSPDAVELLLHWPYLNTDGWLVSNETDAHIYPSLLQAMAAIDTQPYMSYRLTPISALKVDAA